MRARTDLQQVLDRAVVRGDLSRDAADAILVAERARSATASARVGRVSPTVETLGYVGGALVIVSTLWIVGQYWQDIGQFGRLALLGGTTALLLVVATLLTDETDPVVERLRNFVWLLSAAGFVGFVAVLVVDVLGWSGASVPSTLGIALAVYGAALWQAKGRPAPHAATLAGLVTAGAGFMAAVDGWGAIGALTTAIGAAWLAAGLTDQLPPRRIALALGTLTLLVGPALMIAASGTVASVVGVACATALVVTGARTDEFVMTWPGVLGVMIYLPSLMAALFGDAVAPPIIVMVSGLVLLAVMFVLVRRHPGHPGRHAPA